jgi:hypothetical protein
MSSQNFLTNFIECQESAGQRSLVNSAVLPFKGDWEALKKMGVMVTSSDSAADLFYECTLPDGWQKKATDHSMWSELLDQNGLVRASIFYKAAFYDRDAHIDIVKNRYCVSRVYGESKDIIQFKIVDIAAKTDLKVYLGGQYGHLIGNFESEAVGLILGETFYYHAVDSGKHGDEKFLKQTEAKNATPITKDEFYARYHNKDKRCFEVIDAAQNKASEQANKDLADLPTGDAQWLAN